jgi:hypothetical protein
MFLFDSNATSILAENDDGGDGSVASRIDFYPLRDDYYYVQVKNAGDIGGPQQTYDLSLAVVSGPPQPPSTATAGGQPPPGPGTTPGGGAATAQPTKPPVLTPTQGPIEPTPASVGNVPPPVETKEPVEPTKEVLPEPTEPPAAGGPGSGEVEPTATVMVVGVPNTGYEDADNGPGAQNDSKSVPKPVPAEDKPAPAVEKPPAAPAQPQFVSLDFRIFYDHNRNDVYEVNEGIRGINVFFVSSESTQVTGSVVTSDNGIGSLKLPASEHRVQIPYLGIDLKMSKFPARGIASLWLPPVQLPDRVP